MPSVRHDGSTASARTTRQRTKHGRGNAPAADVPQPQRPDQPAPGHGRKREAFGGRASIAQALAGAQAAVFAKAGIEQRFTRSDVRGSLAADRERSGVGIKGNGGLPHGSHGTSVLAPNRSGGV